MNAYDEVILTISLISLAIGLFGVYIYFGYKIKKLEDTVDNLYSYFIAALEPQIKRIREVVNNEIINKKEDNANTCLMPKEGRTMQIMIDIPKEEYKRVMDGKWEGNDLASYIEDGTLYETVTEFADRCRECGREKVLDKIRAEIDQKQYDFMADKDYDEGIRFDLMLAYQIIDKYRAESEG